jgi:hypothetical protein
LLIRSLLAQPLQAESSSRLPVGFVISLDLFNYWLGVSQKDVSFKATPEHLASPSMCVSLLSNIGFNLPTS